jgi:hypothetical protein
MTEIILAQNSLKVDGIQSNEMVVATSNLFFINDTDVAMPASMFLSTDTTTSFNLVNQDFLTYPWSDTGIEDAVYDNEMYVRKNGKWLVLNRVTFPTELDSYLYDKVDELLDWKRVATGQSLDVEGRYISIRDLLLMGIIKRTEDGYEYLEPGVDIVGTGPVYMEIPPAPKNLRVLRDTVDISLFWDPATLFYTNHGKTEIFRNVVDDLLTAEKIKDTVSIFTDTDVTLLSPDVPYFYWIRFVSLTGIEGPFNSEEGTVAQSIDPSQLLEILGGSITTDQLHPSLLAPIELITAPDGLVNSQIQLAESLAQESIDRAAALSAEAIAREQAILLEATDRQTAITEATNILESADQNLAERIDFVTSSTNGTFDTNKLWQFDLIPGEGIDLTEGWTCNSGDPTVTVGRIRPAFSADTYLTSPIFTLEGELFNDIRLRIKKVGNPLWNGNIKFTTNMSEWVDGIITGIRIQLSVLSNSSDYYEIDWIGIGRVGPAASLAAIAEERVAWTTADSAEAALRTTLAAQLRGGYTGTDLDSVSSGLIYEEKVARATSDEALAIQMALLTAGTTNQFDYINIWYFDAGIEGWTGETPPTVATVGWIRPYDSLTYPYIESPVLAIDGSIYPQVRLRAKKTGSPLFLGQLEYITDVDSSWGTAGKVFTISEPTYEDDICLITWSTSGDWLTSTIVGIRITLSEDQSVTDYFEYDWIAIGRPSPGASSAELLDLQQVVTTGFSAVGEDLTTITTELENKADTSVVSLLQSQVTDIDGELTSQGSAITALKSSLGGGGNLVINSELESSILGWDITAGANSTLIESGLDLFIDLPIGVHTIGARVNTNSGGSGLIEISSSVENIPEFLTNISADSRYCFSAFIAGTLLTSVKVGIKYYDIDSQFISEEYSAPVTVPAIVSVSNIADMYRVYAFTEAPADACYGCVSVKAITPVSTNSSRIIVSRPMLEEVSTSQLTPSLYSPSVVGLSNKVFATAEATEALVTEVTQINGVTSSQANQISTLRASLREDNADGELSSALAAWRSEVVFTEEVAARVTTEEANLQRFIELDAVTNTATANISQLQTAVAGNEIAFASQVATLTTSVNQNSASIGQEVL